MSNNLPDFGDLVSDSDYSYYAALTLQLWKKFTGLRHALAQNHGIDPYELWVRSMDLINLTDLLKLYLPNSLHNSDRTPATSTTNASYNLLVAEHALERLQEKLAIEDSPNSQELWCIWNFMHENLIILSETLKLQAFGN
ncbi:MAG: hypothetical protein IGS54_15085 [Elainella sp. C42_A2020_010]|nr:hypothetical protein [Elainella sp. C42_A2020_010]RNJ64827.1 MAG: hypothetical protein EDM05_34455 [Leptolyngbya sp. IPPAS B-1204]